MKLGSGCEASKWLHLSNPMHSRNNLLAKHAHQRHAAGVQVLVVLVEHDELAEVDDLGQWEEGRLVHQLILVLRQRRRVAGELQVRERPWVVRKSQNESGGRGFGERTQL